MKLNIFERCLTFDFEKLFKEKGYAYFTKGYYNLNIIGVRSNHGQKVTNSFDDAFVVIYKTYVGRIVRNVYPITTEPGEYYIKKHLINPKGTAILVPGQYRGCWQIGNHKGKYKALCQKKPVKVYRDNNLDDVYDMNPETIEFGMFGINIHRSDEFRIKSTVDKYSAGCQVFASPIDFRAFMRLCDIQCKNFNNSFTYTLIEEKDLL